MSTSSKTIVCFGDSNTHGYNSSNMGRFTEKERWTCILADLLGSGYLVGEDALLLLVAGELRLKVGAEKVDCALERLHFRPEGIGMELP